MLLYLVAPESSRILRSLVYKEIGLAFREVVVYEKRVRVYRSVTKVTCKVWQRPCLLKCDRGRVYIWQRPCLIKCDRGRTVIYKPSVCLLWSFVWNLLRSFGINNLVVVPTTLRSV